MLSIYRWNGNKFSFLLAVPMFPKLNSLKQIWGSVGRRGPRYIETKGGILVQHLPHCPVVSLICPCWWTSTSLWEIQDVSGVQGLHGKHGPKVQSYSHKWPHVFILVQLACDLKFQFFGQVTFLSLCSLLPLLNTVCNSEDSLGWFSPRNLWVLWLFTMTWQFCFTTCQFLECRYKHFRQSFFDCSLTKVDMVPCPN